VVGYAHRDYGNRVGHSRMADAMSEFGFPGSVSLSVALCDHHPEIVADAAARGWEFFSHGIYNTRYAYGMDPDQERAIIRDSIETVERATGQRIRGWLAPALTHTVNTLDLIAEAGLDYSCDLYHDDQPTLVSTRHGTITAIPYSLEVNDHYGFFVYAMSPRDYADTLIRQYERLAAEGEVSATVMCIPLHAYLIGQPHRIGPFEVESALMEHPAVAEAGVIGKPDPLIGEIVKAFVVLKPGFAAGAAFEQDLLAFARRRLGPSLAPREVTITPALPKTRSGKILRRLLKCRELGLPEGDISTLEDSEPAPPTTPPPTAAPSVT